MTGDHEAVYAGDSLTQVRKEKAPIIQWLPPDSAVPCRVLTPGGMLEGVCEAEAAGYVDETVQFERFGFARIDSVEDGVVIAYFTHR